MSRQILPGGGDLRAEQMLGDLLSCLCRTLEAANRPVCSCCWVRTGASAYLPQTCDASSPQGEGSAWVRIRQRTYTPQSRQSSFGGGRPCGARWEERWSIEAGVARCWPGDEQDLGCTEMTVQAALGAQDEQLLYEAMVCCEGAKPYAVEPTRLYTRGPDNAGGCIAAVFEFTAVPTPRGS